MGHSHLRILFLSSKKGVNLNNRRSLKQLRRNITYSETFINFASGLAMLLIRAYLPLLNIKKTAHAEFEQVEENKYFYAFWHGKLLLLVPAFGNSQITIMTDLSWAGGLLARILRRFGYRVVRGSSKRGGFQGIIHMKNEVASGVAGALAVDGPRGPLHKSKPGILFLAKKLKYPVIPLTFACDRYWVLKQTWDQVVVPKPFSNCLIASGRPIPASELENGFEPEQLDELLHSWTELCDEKIKKSSKTRGPSV